MKIIFFWVALSLLDIRGFQTAGRDRIGVSQYTYI